MPNIIASNPFTPKSGMEPRVFMGREKEIQLFERKIDEALNKRFDHFLVLGDWGMGKTSLLREFKKIAQSRNILASYVPVREFEEGDKFISATEHLIKQIPKGLPIKYENLKNLGGLLKGIGISFPFIGGAIQISDKTKPISDPQVLLIDALSQLWKDVKKESEIIVVLLDDVHNYGSIFGYLTILKNVLSYDEIVQQTGFLFVLSSTYQGWSDFLVKHHPIGRYFIPILKLAPLTEDETLAIVNKTLQHTGVIFEEVIQHRIFEYTLGHPFELQLLCSNLYDNQIGGKVTEKVWDTSLEGTVVNLGEILLDHLYRETTRREREVLSIITGIEEEVEPKVVERKIKQKYPSFPESTIHTHLNRLVTKGMLKKVERGVYQLPDRMFKEYLLKMLQT